MASKKDINDIKSSIHQINTAICEIRDSVIKALQKDNDKLRSRVKQLECEIAENSQYQRRSNVLISGLSEVIENVEPAVIEILNKIDVPVIAKDIQAF